ncbi:MAG TPA: response regulator transcription factor [Anaerolineales bacterium]|nr:response regulator transcription factor [Anaerolineales bacterium]
MGNLISSNLPIRVLIAEDFNLSAIGLAQTLGKASLRFSVLGIVRTITDLLNHESIKDTDLLIMDLCMPLTEGGESCFSHGLTCIQNLHNRFPKLKILVVSATNIGAYVRSALHFGASGFICKGSANIEENFQAYVVEAILATPQKPVLSEEFATQKVHTKNLSGLTDHELAILLMRLQDSKPSDKEIAERLHVSPHTISNIVANARKKLNIKRVEDAKKILQDLGLFDNH